jgi:hypothetical protein
MQTCIFIEYSLIVFFEELERFYSGRENVLGAAASAESSCAPGNI